jgi:PAS domain S-box-containing protein
MNNKLFYYFSVYKTLPLLFIVLSIILASSFTFEQVMISKNRYAISDLTIKAIERQTHIFKIRKDYDSVQVNLLLILFNPVTPETKLIVAEIEKEISNDYKIIKDYKKLTTDATEQLLFKRLVATRDKNNANRKAIINLILDNKRNEALAVESRALSGSYKKYLQAVNELSSYTNKRDNKQIEVVRKSFFHYEKINSIFGYVILVLMISLGFLILRVMRMLQNTNTFLTESERKYRSLIELTTEIIETADKDGKFVSVNNTFKEKLEYDNDEISSLTVLDILAPESQHQYSLNPTKEEYGEVITGIKKTLLSKSGKKIFVEGNVILKYKDGIFESSTAFYNDKTETIRANKALSASQKRYQQLFEFSPLPKWVVNVDNLRIEQVNKAAINLYGYTSEEFLGLTISDLEFLKDNVTLEKAFPSSLKKGDFFHGEVKHRKKNNEIIDVLLYTNVIKQSNKRHLIIIGDDITKWNYSKRHIENQNKKLKSIVWTQSHIVREPLTRMMGLIYLIGDKATTKEETNELLVHILDTAKELDKAIKEIVDTALE